MELAAGDARAAGGVLARAFHDDPVWRWAVPDDAQRARALPWVFARIVMLESRRVHVLADESLAGVGIWVPPGARATSRLELWRAGFPLLPRRLGRDAYARVEAFQTASRELLSRLGYASSWFLSGLGVDPGAQRQGVGTRLVRWGLDRAAESRRPAVLLTSNEDNIPFYDRLGFTTVAEDVLPAGGVRTWALRATPTAA